MRITPLEIKKQEFAVKFRGYSQDEVHAYLEMVASELEDVLRRNLEAEQKISVMAEKLAGYTRIEATLQETLLTVQRTAEDTRSAAEKKAEILVAEAKVRADRMLAEANERMAAIQREYADLRSQRDTFLVSFKSLLATQESLLNLVEKRETGQEQYVPLKKKADLSDAELEKVVNEFEKELWKDGKNLSSSSPGGSPGEEK